MGSSLSDEANEQLHALEPIQATLLSMARTQGHRPEELELRERRGATDYIDFLTPDEMKCPIMFGRDCGRRPFVALLLDEGGHPFVITAFQRYTHEKHPWCVGGPDHWLFFQHNALDIVNKCSLLFKGEKVSSSVEGRFALLGTVKKPRSYEKSILHAMYPNTFDCCPMFTSDLIDIMREYLGFRDIDPFCKTIRFIPPTETHSVHHWLDSLIERMRELEPWMEGCVFEWKDVGILWSKPIDKMQNVTTIAFILTANCLVNMVWVLISENSFEPTEFRFFRSLDDVLSFCVNTNSGDRCKRVELKPFDSEFVVQKTCSFIHEHPAMSVFPFTKQEQFVDAILQCQVNDATLGMQS